MAFEGFSIHGSGGGSSGGGLAALVQQLKNDAEYDEYLRKLSEAQDMAAKAPEMMKGFMVEAADPNMVGQANEHGYVDPRVSPAYQGAMNSILGMIQSGNPELQKAAMVNFSNQFKATVPDAPAYRDYQDPSKQMTDDIKEYQYYATQTQSPIPFEQWLINVKKAGATNFGSTVNNYPKADNKYLEERGKGEADTFNQLTAGADSAYRQKQSLEQFINASANGFEGGAADMLTGAANLFTSFGYNLRPEELQNTRLMEQAVGNILGTKMAELGARGLTDRDMQILKDALPRVQTDKTSRVVIAQILQKSADATISQYKQRVEHERIRYPDNNFYYHPWINDWKPGTTQPTTNKVGFSSVRRVK